MTACAACAMRAPVLPLPASRLALADDPPPLARPPRSGPFDAVDARDTLLVVRAGDTELALRAWCRVGVWTSLGDSREYSFVTRESWGRLGSRPPRRLARIRDQALAGVVARLRPEADGSLSFLVELSRVDTGGARTVGFYHGRRVALGSPRRSGYRFRGRAPPGWRGEVARWGDRLVVLLDVREEGPPPPGALHFVAGEARGFVAGARPGAETFVEVWEPAPAIRVDADGVERMDYRLKKKRRAAGFDYQTERRARRYGGAIRLERHATDR